MTSPPAKQKQKKSMGISWMPRSTPFLILAVRASQKGIMRLRHACCTHIEAGSNWDLLSPRRLLLHPARGLRLGRTGRCLLCCLCFRPCNSSTYYFKVLHFAVFCSCIAWTNFALFGV